jgi:hypothetical protein
MAWVGLQLYFSSSFNKRKKKWCRYYVPPRLTLTKTLVQTTLSTWALGQVPFAHGLISTLAHLWTNSSHISSTFGWFEKLVLHWCFFNSICDYMKRISQALNTHSIVANNILKLVPKFCIRLLLPIVFLCKVKFYVMEIWNDGKMRVKECFPLLGPSHLKNMLNQAH